MAWVTDLRDLVTYGNAADKIARAFEVFDTPRHLLLPVCLPEVDGLYTLDDFGVSYSEVVSAIPLPICVEYCAAARQLWRIPWWLRWLFPGRRKRYKQARREAEAGFARAVMDAAMARAKARELERDDLHDDGGVG